MFEAKTKLSELVRKAQAGETVIITSGRDKTPVAELKAIAPVKPQRIGFLKHLDLPPIPDSVWFDPLPEDELRLWEEGEPDDPCYAGPSSTDEKAKK
jgi:antitoxin (DNA-binding transcriptional repressor) of toxin-antitoxin stability system